MSRVSVIVPLFNKADYIGRALASISAQTFEDFEVIVVDDGSTDDGAERARKHSDKRVKVLTQPNGGPGAARNRGVAEASGELLAFLDADDEWMPDYLQRGVLVLDELGPRVVSTTCGWFDYPAGTETADFWGKRGIIGGLQGITAETSAKQLAYMLAYMSPCSTIARAQAVQRYGGFYDRDHCTYAEDATLFLKMLLNERVHFDLRRGAIFHREASSLSGNYRGARPVEPFLVHPEEVESLCPSELLPLLRHFYALRACKTASVLAYWGDWRRARAVLKQFRPFCDWRTPYLAPALVGATPVGALCGRALRAIRPL